MTLQEITDYCRSKELSSWDLECLVSELYEIMEEKANE